MNIEHHKWYSEHLGHDMDLKVYGHDGRPFMVFPTSSGRYFDFEDQGMVDTISAFIDAGQMVLYAVDGIDQQSWDNKGVSAQQIGDRHNDYDNYIVREVIPFIHTRQGNDTGVIGTGVSMGATHAVNFFFRHPDSFNGCIALSGVYDMGFFTGGDQMPESIYYNSPVSYLPTLSDDWYLSRYRQSKIIICVGQGAWEEPMLTDTKKMKEILENKNVPAWIDIWGEEVNHDWPWWHKQLPYFLDKTLNI